ncbi:MAG: hypothetical protein HOK54_15920, partial [Alphaproteobacteria bacterium]|nr:hypothetical protein [Alphaproteobacteria bacterium]
GRERRARRGRPPSASGKSGGKPALAKDADTIALERALTNGIGVKVDITFDGTGGSVRIDYTSLEQLDDLVERLMGNGPRVAGSTETSASENLGFGRREGDGE